MLRPELISTGLISTELWILAYIVRTQPEEIRENCFSEERLPSLVCQSNKDGQHSLDREVDREDGCLQRRKLRAWEYSVRDDAGEARLAIKVSFEATEIAGRR